MRIRPRRWCSTRSRRWGRGREPSRVQPRPGTPNLPWQNGARTIAVMPTWCPAGAGRGTDMAVAVEPSRNAQYQPPKQQAPAADQHVGRRIREWRMILGVSQRTLSGQIGVTSQQLRKYERGTYRISAASLYRVARSLGVSIDCFFEDLAKGSALVPRPQQRLLLKLTRSLAGISDPKLQAALSELVRVLATEPANKDEPAAE